jgi:uncharacterized glyoxalase superfamily protein PhnB
MDTTNRTVYPVLRYADAPAALNWLARAFGFEERAVVPGPEGTIAHALMRFGDGVIMLSSEYGESQGLLSPKSLGATTVAIHVYVADVDAHHARAVAGGAEIVSEPRDTPHGSRDYAARDPEGHMWAFSTYRP